MSVRIEHKATCLIVRNTAEKRGAITPELYQAIPDAIAKAADPRIHSVILTGGAFFCGGGDLRLLKTRAALPPEGRREKVELLHAVIRAMQDSPVPLIAAVEGGAAGAGLSLTLACDLIVAAEEASFTAAYVKAGLTPDGGLTHAMTRLMPRQMAMEACLLGRPISARRLAELGVVTELSANGAALDRALDIAALLAQGPRQAQSRIRALLTAAEGAGLSAQLDREAQAMVEAQGSPDAAEGIAAFLEKRKPEFNA